MKIPFCVLTTVVLLLSVGSVAVAQSGSVPLPTRPRPGHVEPCWQQVGISKTAMREREAINRETRMQVEGVCADKSLTPQQRQEKIREIHAQAKERSEALISPQQQEALRACQKERAGTRPPSSGLHRGGGGPCGEMIPSSRHPNPQGGPPQTEKPPSEEEPPPQD